MSLNAAIIAFVVGISPSIVLAAVLLLVGDQGRSKAVALALGWVVALVVVAGVALVAVRDLGFTRHSSHSKALDLVDLVLGAALLVSGVVLLVRDRGAGAMEPKWLQRLDAIPTYGAFLLGAFLPPYVLVVAGVSEIVRYDRGLDARGVAALLFILVGSIGAFAPLAIALVSRDPDRVLARWHTWIVANWRRVLAGICLLGGVYLLVKGTVEWRHDASTASTAAAAYRPGA